MSSAAPTEPRRASSADASAIAELLHRFATEFGDPSPGLDALARQVRSALALDDVLVLVAGRPPAGVGVLTFRPSLWTGVRTATLDDLYVVPERRGRGLGRALLRAALDAARERGAASFELYTGEGDAAARRLYEAHGLTNAEPGGGSRLLFYVRPL